MMIKEFQKMLEIWMLAKIEILLGLLVEDSGNTIKIHNKDMMERILEFLTMEICRPVATRPPHEIDLSLESG